MVVGPNSKCSQRSRPCRLYAFATRTKSVRVPADVLSRALLHPMDGQPLVSWYWHGGFRTFRVHCNDLSAPEVTQSGPAVVSRQTVSAALAEIKTDCILSPQRSLFRQRKRPDRSNSERSFPKRLGQAQGRVATGGFRDAHAHRKPSPPGRP
jgi:hypothetical protein